MTPVTKEWAEKAEGDFRTATREMAVTDDPNYDAVCFHSQQCAEKYLKAQLQEWEIPFGKTHNLMSLLEILIEKDGAWEVLHSETQGLNVFAVEVRYPGTSADKEMAAETLDSCAVIRRYVRIHLGLIP